MFGSVGFKKFRFQVFPVGAVESRKISQGMIPRESSSSETEIEFIASPFSTGDLS